MSKKSSTYDEAGHLEFGRRILTEKTVKPIMQRMAVTALNFLPLYIIEKSGRTLKQEEKLFVSRIPTVMASLLLAYFVFLWTKKLYGIKAGLFSLLIYTFCPNILAHSRLITNDIYCTFFMFVSTYFFINYLQQPSGKNLITSATLTGFAQLSKHTALMLFPLFILLYILNILVNISKPAAKQNPVSLKKICQIFLHITLFLAVVLLIINLGYAFKEITTSQKFFLPLPKAYVQAFLAGKSYNLSGEGHGLIYLLGKLSRYGFWYYYAVCLFFKLPLAISILGLISLIILRKYLADNFLEEATLIIVPLAVFSFFSFFCTAQIGIRYLLPAFPFVLVFLGKTVSYTPPKLKRLYKSGLLLLLSWFLFSSLSFYPHYLSYFNELIGARKNMYKYLADSNVDWGQNEFYLNEYLKKHCPEKNVFVMPNEPVRGTVIVSLNHLLGIFPSLRQKYSWLKNHYEPVGHIAYSWLIYRIPPESNKARP